MSRSTIKSKTNQIHKDSDDESIGELEQYSAANNRRKKITKKSTSSPKQKTKGNKKVSKSDSDSSDSDDSDNSDSDDQSNNKFSKSVMEWVKADNEQKRLLAEKNKFNKDKKMHGDIIVKFLINRKKESVGITGGRLAIDTKTRKAPIKEGHLVEVLTKKVGPKKALEYVDDIYDELPEVTKVSLKRLKDKKK